MFDRSWYGRVLVERVEGYATSAEWQRAYDEINEDHGKDSDEILTHRPAWLTGEGLSPDRVCTTPC